MWILSFSQKLREDFFFFSFTVNTLLHTNFPPSGGAELNAALAEGGGTFCLDPDLEAKCDSRAVTTRSRCVSGAAVSLSSAETLFPLQEEKPRIVFCQGKTRVVLILAGVTEIRKVGKSQASELSKYRGQEDVHITHRSLLIFSTSGRL